MALATRKPKLISGKNRYARLFQTDDDYIESRVRASSFKDGGEAIRHYVNLAIRIERSTEAGKDETMYAVVKKQETVVLEGTRPLVAKLEEVGELVRTELARQSVAVAGLEQSQNANLNEVRERIERLEAEASAHTAAVSRLIEISIICYGILRHYVLGLFAVRLTKTKFEDYCEGFKKRLDVFRANIRTGNLLLEGDYEKQAEEFSRHLSHATGVNLVNSNEEQAAAQKITEPILDRSALTVPDGFPRN
jgi:hypothetical protein